MKLKQIITALLLSGFIGYSQNVASTANLTSGGLNAGASGTGNTFYGTGAGRANTTGVDNTFIGSISGYDNTSGSYNTYIGKYSGVDSNGSYNTYIGVNAGGDSYGSNNLFLGFNAGYSQTTNNKLYIENSESITPLIWGDFSLDQLKLNAKVGIGNGFPNFPTTAGSVNVSNYNLFVKGGILTDEVRVSTTWADYVFEKGYDLKPLSEVEEFIKKNGHLPNVPSAQKVQEDGIELGEMAKIQQEKIEELTLYLIELSKENNELQLKVLELEKKVNNLNATN